MNVLKSYAIGLKNASLKPKMVWVLWLVNFIFGGVIFFLLYSRLSKALAQSALSENLVKKFDYNFLFEFLVYHGQSFQTIFSLALVLVVVYFLTSLFLYGGILYTLIQPDKKGFAAAFFQGAGKFFGRFFRLAVYSLLLWVAFFLFMTVLVRVVQVLTANRGSEQMMLYIFLVEVAVGLFLFFLIKMILDYTRIRIAAGDSRFVFRSLLQTLRYIFQKLGKTLALYYLLLVTGGILFVGYGALQSMIPASSLITIFGAFVLGQVLIAVRAWLKIAFQSAQLSFYSLEPF